MDSTFHVQRLISIHGYIVPIVINFSDNCVYPLSRFKIKTHQHACLHYRIRWDWILSKQPIPFPRDKWVSYASSFDVEREFWLETRIIREGRWKSLLTNRKLLLTRKNCISNWKMIRRKRSWWKFRSNLKHEIVGELR